MFHSYVNFETGWPMFNVHLSYKRTSYWRIMFWYGVIPSQLSFLINVRALKDPSRVSRKQEIIQRIQLNLIFSCGRPVMIKKKS